MRHKVSSVVVVVVQLGTPSVSHRVKKLSNLRMAPEGEIARVASFGKSRSKKKFHKSEALSVVALKSPLKLDIKDPLDP